MTTVRLAGVGLNKTVQVEDGSPLSLVIEEAQIDAANTGEQQLRVRRANGEVVDVDDPRTFTPGDNDTVVVVPPQVKLGA